MVVLPLHAEKSARSRRTRLLAQAREKLRALNGREDVGERSARAGRQSPTRARISTRSVLTRVEHSESDCEQARAAPLGFESALFCAAIGGILKRPRAPMAQARRDPTLSVEYNPRRPSKCPRPPSLINLMCIHGHVQQCDWFARAGERRILYKACAEAFSDGHAPGSRSVPPPSSASASGTIANCIARTERGGQESVVNVHTLPSRSNPRARVRSHPSLPL